MIKKRVRNLWKMDSIQPKTQKLFCWFVANETQCVISDTVEDAYSRLTNDFIKRNSCTENVAEIPIKNGVISLAYVEIGKYCNE